MKINWKRLLLLGLLLVGIFLLNNRGVAQDNSCPTRRYNSGDHVVAIEQVVARYDAATRDPHHGNPGRFNFYAGDEIVLTGEPACSDGSWWWLVEGYIGNQKGMAWVPEDGAYSLPEPQQPVMTATPTVPPAIEGLDMECRVRGETIVASEETVVVKTNCLNVRSTPVLYADDRNVMGKAKKGSRFVLVDPDQSSVRWYQVWLTDDHSETGPTGWISGTGQKVYSERDVAHG